LFTYVTNQFARLGQGLEGALEALSGFDKLEPRITGPTHNFLTISEGRRHELRGDQLKEFIGNAETMTPRIPQRQGFHHLGSELSITHNGLAVGSQHSRGRVCRARGASVINDGYGHAKIMSRGGGG